MELKSVNIRDFALENEIPYTTIRSILECGILNAKAETVFKICSILNIRPKIFEQSKLTSPILQSITETSSKLEENRQIIVLNTAKHQLDEQNSSISNQEELFKYDYYDQPASAGTGQYLNDVNKETVELAVNIDADFVIPIYGDSMEPEYHSGDYAFIKTTVNLDDGQVGVFDLKGDTYIKQLIIDENKACLHSFNKEYKDIPIHKFSDFRIIGKIVGKFR
ncbi:MAG: S24 family peptidase [Streptococcus sp.]|nr:S24 family peptidase [Streptococcus sp.]